MIVFLPRITINWQAELQLPEFPHLDSCIAAPTMSSISSVFLTGATGFLGIFMLREILEQIPSSKVYCLVRCENEAAAKNKLLQELAKCQSWKEEYASRIVIVFLIVFSELT